MLIWPFFATLRHKPEVGVCVSDFSFEGNVGSKNMLREMLVAKICWAVTILGSIESGWQQLPGHLAPGPFTNGADFENGRSWFSGGFASNFNGGYYLRSSFLFLRSSFMAPRYLRSSFAQKLFWSWFSGPPYLIILIPKLSNEILWFHLGNHRKHRKQAFLLYLLWSIYWNMVKNFYFVTMIMSTFKASPNASWIWTVAFPFLSPSLWFEFTLKSACSFWCFFFLWRFRFCFAPNIFPHSSHFSLAWQVLCLSSLGWFGKLIGFLEHFPEMQIYCPFPVWLCINLLWSTR